MKVVNILWASIAFTVTGLIFLIVMLGGSGSGTYGLSSSDWKKYSGMSGGDFKAPEGATFVDSMVYEQAGTGMIALVFDNCTQYTFFNYVNYCYSSMGAKYNSETGESFASPYPYISGEISYIDEESSFYGYESLYKKGDAYALSTYVFLTDDSSIEIPFPFFKDKIKKNHVIIAFCPYSGSPLKEESNFNTSSASAWLTEEEKAKLGISDVEDAPGAVKSKTIKSCDSIEFNSIKYRFTEFELTLEGATKEEAISFCEKISASGYNYEVFGSEELFIAKEKHPKNNLDTLICFQGKFYQNPEYLLDNYSKYFFVLSFVDGTSSSKSQATIIFVAFDYIE